MFNHFKLIFHFFAKIPQFTKKRQKRFFWTEKLNEPTPLRKITEHKISTITEVNFRFFFVILRKSKVTNMALKNANGLNRETKNVKIVPQSSQTKISTPLSGP